MLWMCYVISKQLPLIPCFRDVVCLSIRQMEPKINDGIEKFDQWANKYQKYDPYWYIDKRVLFVYYYSRG